MKSASVCVQIMNIHVLPMDLFQCLECSKINSSSTCTCTIGLLCIVAKAGASLVTIARPHVCVKVRSLHLNTVVCCFLTMYMYSVCICVPLVGELLGGGI